MNSSCIEIHIPTAKKAITKIGEHARNYKSHLHNYIFRGQGDVAWKILPSAFRDDTVLYKNKYSQLPKDRTNREQIEAEHYLLSAFCEQLNLSGQYIPNDEILNLRYNGEYIDYHTKIGRGETPWPSNKFETVMAIAQHHGLPTRLVDWSWDPFVALFFAAHGSIDCNSDYFAVYVSCEMAGSICGIDKQTIKPTLRHAMKNNKEYKVLQSSSWINANLKAQKGLFLCYIDNKLDANDFFVPSSIEDIFEETNSLVKYIIPRKCADEILDILTNKFYTASFLFPGFGGCVQNLRHRHKGLGKQKC